MKYRIAFATVVAAASLAATGCGEGVHPEQREVVYFSALETDPPDPVVHEDPGPSLTKAQLNSYDPIVNGFIKNADELLRRGDIHSQLERIENVFVITGRYLDLVAIYQKDFDKLGTQSAVAKRLGWAYIRLGQQKQALDHLEVLEKAAPDDPDVHFLEGAYWVQQAQADPAALAKAIPAWERVIELDPNFRGFENISAQMIQRQLEQFRRRVPPDALSQEDPLTAARSSVARAASEADEADSPTGGSDASAPAEQAAPSPSPQPPVQAPGQPTPEAQQEGAETSPGQASAPPAQAPAAEDPDRAYRLLVARGELALTRGNSREAEEHFVKAQGLRPGAVAAVFGQLRAAWSSESARNEVARRVRKLAERDDLTARQAYEIGLFAHSKMSDDELARKLWEQVKRDDPALATQLGLDALIKRLR